MIRSIWKAGNLTPGLISTVEYAVGARAIPASRTTPDAATVQAMLAQMLAADCRSAVMEVSSHALDQKRVAGIDFDVAVFTNLTRDHLDYHKTFDDYFRAKSQLFLNLGRGRKKAVGIINADDSWGEKLRNLDGVVADRVTYGLTAPADVRAEDVRLGPENSLFTARTPWGDAEVVLPLMGRYNVSNALAALAACVATGSRLAEVADVLGHMQPVPGRLEKMRTRRGVDVFVDYAHTDDALERVLETLRELTAHRVIAVFGCGGKRDRSKRPAMGRVAARLADMSIITSDNPRTEDPMAIIEEIRAGFGGEGRHEVIEDRARAIERALEMAEPGDLVLVAGKGHETFQEFGNRTVPFDDRQVVRKYI
jgi:UDP-N-acetylmuramoyl-L-alanyl-D-glutamate--2,6-diaminopimelate ligase